MKQIKTKDWKRETLYVGIDLHKRKWVVTVRTFDLELKTFTTIADKNILLKSLHNGWFGARFKAVYEAGCFGYHLAEFLNQNSIKTSIVSPQKIPVEPGNHVKTDPKDSRKLARELSKGDLIGIYCPSKQAQLDRALMRKRNQIVKRKVQIQLQIRAILTFYGINANFPMSGQWSKEFLKELKSILFDHQFFDKAFKQTIEEYEYENQKLKEINKMIIELSKTERFKKLVTLLCTVPGIATLTAMVLILELVEIRRFSNADKLSSYLGLTPSEHSSGEKVRRGHLTGMGNSKLRNILIEASWVAIRKDLALLEKFNRVRRGKSKTRAIVSVAKSMAARIRRVWLTGEPYVLGVVQ